MESKTLNEGKRRVTFSNWVNGTLQRANGGNLARGNVGHSFRKWLQCVCEMG